MEPAVRTLLASPQLPRHLRVLTESLAEEQARRARFIEEVEEGTKAEFINGEAIVHSPAKKRHTDSLGRQYRLLSLYVQKHDLGWVGYEKVMVSLTRNDYEPDVCFFGRAKAAELAADQVRFPAPDFAAEVLSPSTEARDRGIKQEDYAAHGVAEYWILDPVAETVEQYVLEGEGEEARYTLRMKSPSGEVESVVVEGLRVPVRALFDDAENVEAVRRLLAA